MVEMFLTRREGCTFGGGTAMSTVGWEGSEGVAAGSVLGPRAILGVASDPLAIATSDS